MSNTKHASMIVIAGSTKRALLEAGASEDEAEQVFSWIAHIAGRYLPPVSGTLHLKFDDAEVKT